VGKASRTKEERRRLRPQLLEALREHLLFLRSSAAAFDDGFEGEAKRLAVTLRLLVHDTKHSHSLLDQLGVKNALRYVDTAEHINSANLMATMGLVHLQMTAGVGGRYVAPLDNLAPPRVRAPVHFDPWWTREVTKEQTGELWSRHKYVLTLANKEGGAHVNRNLDDDYERLARTVRFGWTYAQPGRDPNPFQGDPVAASVRQVAHEMIRTLDANPGIFD